MNFPDIHLSLKFKEINFYSSINDEKNIERICRNLQLLKMVTILTPEIDTSNINSIFNSYYYSIEGFSIADLLSKSIMEGYINLGHFSCVSIHRNENIKFYISQKKLFFRIDKNIFQTLGAIYLARFQKRYGHDDFSMYFEIDLSISETEKIRQELKHINIDKVEINFMWHHLSEEICSSSIAKYFSDAGYSVKAVKNKNKSFPVFGLSLPKLPTTLDEFDWKQTTECIGMLMLQCDVDENSCSSYQLPDTETINVGRGKILHFKGFITYPMICSLLTKIQEEVKKESSIPYIALSTIPLTKLQRNSYSRVIVITSDEIFIAE